MKYILQFSQSVVLLVTRCPPPWSCWALKASQSRLWHLTLNHPPFPSFRFHANMCCHLWVPALIMKCCSSPSVLDYLHKARKWSDMGEGVCLKSHCYWSERVLVVDAEHHLMHISLEPTRSLASTTFFFFFCFLGQLPTLKTCDSLLHVMKDSPLVSARDEGERSAPTRFQPVQLAPKE